MTNSLSPQRAAYPGLNKRRTLGNSFARFDICTEKWEHMLRKKKAGKASSKDAQKS